MEKTLPLARSAREKISLPVFCMLWVAYTLPLYFGWAFVCAALAFRIVKKRGKMTVRPMPGRTIWLYLFLNCTLIGMVEYSLNGGGSLWPWFRDIVFFSYWGINWLLWSNVLEPGKNKIAVMYRTLFLFCAIYSVANILPRVHSFFIANENYKLLYGQSAPHDILACGVALAIFRPPVCGRSYFGRKTDLAMAACIITALIISFSRNAFLEVLCLLLPFLFKSAKGLKKSVRILLILSAFVFVAALLWPDAFQYLLYKTLRSFEEISHDRSRWNAEAIVKNWRGYEAYCTIQEYKTYSVFEQLFGKGFGSSIDVRGYAYLVTSESTVPFLHSGYYTTLFKAGAVGLLLNFAFFGCYFRTVHIKGEYNKSLRRGITLAMAASAIGANGVFWHHMSLTFVLLLVLFELHE